MPRKSEPAAAPSLPEGWKFVGVSEVLGGRPCISLDFRGPINGREAICIVPMAGTNAPEVGSLNWNYAIWNVLQEIEQL